MFGKLNPLVILEVRFYFGYSHGSSQFVLIARGVTIFLMTRERVLYKKSRIVKLLLHHAGY